MTTVLNQSKISINDLSDEARQRPIESQQKILQRAHKFLRQLQKIFALEGFQGVIEFIKTSLFFKDMVSEEKYNAILQECHKAQRDSNKKTNHPQQPNQGNPQKQEQKPERNQIQWIWWIVFTISAVFLGYLVFHFGVCASIIATFKFTSTYAQFFIGGGLVLLVTTASAAIASVVKWFFELFK